MPLDDLQRDLAANMDEVKRLYAANPGDPVLGHLLNTVWPFQEAVLEEMEATQTALDDAIEQADDILHSESAATFAAVITLGVHIAEELEKRLGPSETQLREAIKNFREQATEGASLLQEITVLDPEDEEVLGLDSDDDDDDDDDDEDEDEDEDEEHDDGH